MRVAAVQFRATRGDVEGSRARLVQLVERAAVDVDLVVCPEMAVTGYVFPDREAVRAVAEPAQGPTFEALREIARARRCHVVAGFPELAGEALYNSAWVIDDRGELVFVYRKTLLYTEDRHWATPGDSGYPLLEIAGLQVGVGICMDINDDRFVDWLDESGCEAVAFPTNWVRSEDGVEIDLWTYWAWRLGSLPVALIAADTWGVDGSFVFEGRSAVLQQRRILAALPERGDGILRAVIERPRGR